MIGSGNDEYRYYVCSNHKRLGREVCSSASISKSKLESLIVERLKNHVLTYSNLEELVKLSNEETPKAIEEERGSLNLLVAELADVENRMSKVYDAIETGEFKTGELAPRLRELQTKRDTLKQTINRIEEASNSDTENLLNLEEIKDNLEGLKDLLATAEVDEQRGVLKSFIDKIEIDGREVSMHYTISPLAYSYSTQAAKTLPFVQSGEGVSNCLD